MVELARIGDIDDVMKIFRSYPKIFPHIRKDKIKDLIDRGCVIYQDGVVLTFGQYQKRITLGDTIISKGSWIIHQIVSKNQGNGKAVTVLTNFLNEITGTVYLTVRAENTRARKFYENNGFIDVGEISWKEGTIAGKIYKKVLT